MKRNIFILFTVTAMIMIFCFSMENSSESSVRSRGIAEYVAEFFTSGYDDMSASEKRAVLKHTEHIIRKLAHYSIYTVLGLFMSCAVGKRRLFCPKSLAVLACGFLYACSDEIHQYFVAGRSCSFRDVLIDTCGVATGIIVSMLLFRIYCCFKHESSSKSPRQ